MISIPIIAIFYFLSIDMIFAAICFLLPVIVIKSQFNIKDLKINGIGNLT
jgi:hypothetical protein